jgi:hypothetical protein
VRHCSLYDGPDSTEKKVLVRIHAIEKTLPCIALHYWPNRINCSEKLLKVQDNRRLQTFLYDWI